MENHEDILVTGKSDNGNPNGGVLNSASGITDSGKPQNGQKESKIIHVARLVTYILSILSLLAIIIGVPWTLYIYKSKELSESYSILESQWRASRDNHKSKIEYLERRIDDLHYDNKKYLNWLQNVPQSIPFLDKHIKKLEERIKELEEEIVKLKGAGIGPTIPKHPIEPEATYLYFKELQKGDAFVDPLSGAAIGISEIYEDNTAPISLTLPGQPTKHLTRVLPGTSWNYVYKGTTYQITITTIRWLTGNYIVEVREVGK